MEMHESDCSIGALEAVHRRVLYITTLFSHSFLLCAQEAGRAEDEEDTLICPITSRKITFPAFFPYAP